MSAWAYCKNCNAPIQQSEYTASDICSQTYACPNCGTQNDVMGYSLFEFLQDLSDRVSELETKLEV